MSTQIQIQKQDLVRKYKYYEDRVEDPNRYKDIEDGLNEVIKEFEVRMKKTRSKAQKAIYDIMIELCYEVLDAVDKARSEIKETGVYGEGLAIIYEGRRLLYLIFDLTRKYKIAEGIDKKIEKVYRMIHDMYRDLIELKMASEDLASRM